MAKYVEGFVPFGTPGPGNVSVYSSDGPNPYVSVRHGSHSGEYVFRLDLPDAIRLVRHLQAAIDAQAPGAYFPQETIEDAADGLIALDQADRRERGE